MKMSAPKLSALAALLILFSTSCNKLVPIQCLPCRLIDFQQTPFQTYLDSVLPLSSEDILLNVQGIALNDLLQTKFPQDTIQGTGQAEIAYAFRTSDSGVVNELGVYLPTGGFAHTVTLWDSATGQVLAQANVTNATGGKWAYLGLPVNQLAVLSPNHGYIVGFNSLAVGNAMNVYNPGNMVYTLQGIYNFDNDIPGGIVQDVFPFTEGNITYEGTYEVLYDTPISGPIFPPSGDPYGANSNTIGFLGVCDIGFIPQ
jgi:hypothetical protein